MPILNGYEATKIIKRLANEIGGIIKIIGFTAFLNDEVILECEASGMDYYLLKPASESFLFKIVLKAF